MMRNLRYKCGRSSTCSFTGLLQEVVAHKNQQVCCVTSKKKSPKKAPECTSDCRLCKQEFTEKDPRNDHVCTQSAAFRSCSKHNLVMNQGITHDRILSTTNSYNSRKLFQSFTCSICQEMAYMPRICSACTATFCTPCLAKDLNNKNGTGFCRSCHLNASDFALPLNLHFILEEVRVACKNADEGCHATIDFFSLARHQIACEQCPKCLYLCTEPDGCGQFVQYGNKINHFCAANSSWPAA